MATRNEAKVLGGHTARILIDGQDVGWMQGVTWNIDGGLQAVNVIGATEDQEHQQTRYIVSGEITRHYVRDMIVETSKLGARNSVDLIRTGTFDLLVLDDVTRKPIVTLVSCTLGSKGSGVQANTLVTQRFSFRALNTR